MSRDHVVSVRLTEAEYARLKKRGRVSDAVRALIEANAAGPLPRGETRSSYVRPRFIWRDGTANGGTWPEPTTG